MWQGPLRFITADQGGEFQEERSYAVDFPVEDPNEIEHEEEGYHGEDQPDGGDGDHGGDPSDRDEGESGSGDDPTDPGDRDGLAEAEMREEESPEYDSPIDESDQDVMLNYVEPESSEPFSEAPGMPTPSPDGLGHVPRRFNGFGGGRDPPEYPYGPPNSSSTDEENQIDEDFEEANAVFLAPTGRRFHL